MTKLSAVAAAVLAPLAVATASTSAAAEDEKAKPAKTTQGPNEDDSKGDLFPFVPRHSFSLETSVSHYVPEGFEPTASLAYQFNGDFYGDVEHHGPLTEVAGGIIHAQAAAQLNVGDNFAALSIALPAAYLGFAALKEWPTGSAIGFNGGLGLRLAGSMLLMQTGPESVNAFITGEAPSLFATLGLRGPGGATLALKASITSGVAGNLEDVGPVAISRAEVRGYLPLVDSFAAVASVSGELVNELVPSSKSLGKEHLEAFVGFSPVPALEIGVGGSVTTFDFGSTLSPKEAPETTIMSAGARVAITPGRGR